MTQTLILIIALGLVIYGLERNHRRFPHLYTRLHWGTDTEDRDAARFRADLRAARDHDNREPTQRLPWDDRTKLPI